MTTSSQQLLLLRNLTKMFNKRCHTDMQIVSLSFCCMQMKIMALLIMYLIVFLFFFTFPNVHFRLCRILSNLLWNRRYEPFESSPALHLCNLKLFICWSHASTLTWHDSMSTATLAAPGMCIHCSSSVSICIYQFVQIYQSFTSWNREMF